MADAARLSSAARVVLVLLALVSCAVWAAPAAATRSHRPGRAAPASRVVLGGAFQQMKAVGAGGVVASGDYLLLSTTVSGGFGTGWIVINQRVGTTTALDPQCQFVGLGPPWVLMSCPQTSNPGGPFDAVLYSLTDGTRQTVTPSPGLPLGCGQQSDAETECASAVAVGAYWIKWDASCYHCAVTSFFQNIETGELRDDPTNATTFADLNSPALAHRTCPGVRLMREPDSLVAWPSLTPDGQFALVTDAGNSVLERCGTRMRRPLTNGSSVSYALAWNAGAVVWQAVTGRLNGLLLPSLQTFTIPLPSAVVKPPGSLEGVPVSGLALTSDALYVRDGWAGTTWQTASPTALPLNTSRPELTRSGNVLTCGPGNWRTASRFSYRWRVNGTAQKVAAPRLTVGRAGKRRSVSCSVTASNAAGTTTASSAQLQVR
jgi:hypothetical protein